MSIVQLNTTSCVRSLSVDSICRHCEDVCPTNAVVISETNPLPALNLSVCVGCGACGGLCPTESFSLDDFSATNFFFEFLEDDDNLISCKKNVPCIAALSVEHLISLSVLKKDIVLDTGHCEGCEIAHTCLKQIEKNHEEATYLLEAMENSAELKLENVGYERKDEADRREFLSSMNLKTVAHAKRNFENEVERANDELLEHNLEKTDIALLKKKKLPEKRQLFFTAMKRAEVPSTFHTVEGAEVSFTSQKLMDQDACTACQMCYRVCPTGALTSDLKNSKIDFDPLMCVKCHICHDVCAPNAITKSSAYNVKEFFEPSVQSLISFHVKRCNECNVIFSTNNPDDVLCYRCKTEEEEARALWGIDEKY